MFSFIHANIYSYIHIESWMCVHVSQDEWYLVDLQDISSFSLFSGKTLHYSIPMMLLVMSLMTLSVLSKPI